MTQPPADDDFQDRIQRILNEKKSFSVGTGGRTNCRMREPLPDKIGFKRSLRGHPIRKPLGNRPK